MRPRPVRRHARGTRVPQLGPRGHGRRGPSPAKLLGAVALIVEVDEARADRRLESGYLDEKVVDIDTAIERVTAARAANEACSVALIANAADALPELLSRGFADIVTDQTSAHDARYGYVPNGLGLEQANALREADADAYERDALRAIREHVESMLGFQERGSVVFEYGNAIRQQAERAGLAAAAEIDGFVQLFVRPSFCVGRGPCRWVALSGDPQDITTIDHAVIEEFADDPSVTSWIRTAMEHVPQQGLPARTSWFDYRQRVRFGLLVNRLVANGRVTAPVAMTRDHLDSGAVAQPTRETEGMLDGTDAVADWPILNALLNASAGADLVAVHQGGGSGMGGSISAGVTLVIDGTEEARGRVERVLRTDPGIGVVRHADAGYESSRELVRSSDLAVPALADRA